MIGRAALLLALWSGGVAAEPFASASSGSVTITLRTGPCALPAVRNLLGRATWTEGAKTFEGCWAINSFRIVVIYFDDRTATALQISA